MNSIVSNEHVRARLEPVISALQQIDGEAVMYDPDIFEAFAGLLLWAERVVSAVDAPQAEPCADQEMQESTDTSELVTRVSLRTLTLSMLIDAENRLGKSVVDQYERDLAEAKFSGTTVAEIKKIEADADARAEAHRLNIIDLSDRKASLEAFLASGPNHDFALLQSTEFELAMDGE